MDYIQILRYLGFLSTIGLIIIPNFSSNYLWCSIFWPRNQSHQMMICKLKKLGINSKVDFFLVACGSAGFAFICLSSIPTFTAAK
jgi:hypothetical protein